MPLNTYHVTDYSRFMIPVYPLVAAGFGISWAITPTSVLKNTPTFQLILGVLPGWAWGLLYIMSATILAIAVVSESRKWYIRGLRLLGYSASLFAVLNFIAFFATGATFSSWIWPAFLAYTTRVTGISLKRHEEEPLFDAPSAGSTRRPSSA